MIKIVDLGRLPYQQAYASMVSFNNQHSAEIDDELWLLEHPPVYTLGLAVKKQHLIDTADILVVQTDRGGQVTYHGLGQLVVYLMVDLKRRPYSLKKFVWLIEQAVIDYVAQFDILGDRVLGAPGVYIEHKKLAAIGIRVRHGCSYHGLAINVAMDLQPFSGINPCGYQGLQCTQLAEYVDNISIDKVKQQLSVHLLNHLDQPMVDISTPNTFLV